MKRIERCLRSERCFQIRPLLPKTVSHQACCNGAHRFARVRALLCVVVSMVPFPVKVTAPVAVLHAHDQIVLCISLLTLLIQHGSYCRSSFSRMRQLAAGISMSISYFTSLGTLLAMVQRAL